MTKQEQLIQWVKSTHEGQVIKLTGEPYFAHVVAVAVTAAPAFALAYEVGLCHDLLEKTATDLKALFRALTGFGYNEEAGIAICSMVAELTNIFTTADYPELSKSTRRKMEDERLTTISTGAQTVKYADLLYNINWMMKYDLKHAKKYLKRKKTLLSQMAAGDPALLQQTRERIDQCLLSFDEPSDRFRS